MTSSVVVGLLAETFIHPGASDTLGVVDLPVARESATDYPFLPGSGLKGALRECWETRQPDQKAEVDRLFGAPTQAGGLSVSDARLALLPIRSLDGPYAWTTCPYALERLERDFGRAGLGVGFARPEVAQGQALVAPGRVSDDPIVLEELSFRRSPLADVGVAESLERLVGAPARDRLRSQLVVVSDEDFAWFARFALAVQARNVLEDATKRSVNLWYEEALPPDTVLYALITAREAADADAVAERLRGDPYLQIGGKETVGQGWVRLQVLEAEGKAGGAQ